MVPIETSLLARPSHSCCDRLLTVRWELMNRNHCLQLLNGVVWKSCNKNYSQCNTYVFNASVIVRCEVLYKITYLFRFTVKHFLLARTLFSHKLGRSQRRENEVLANNPLCMDCS